MMKLLIAKGLKMNKSISISRQQLLVISILLSFLFLLCPNADAQALTIESDFQSNNKKSSTYAIDGDSVSFSFSSDVQLNLSGVVSVGDKEITLNESIENSTYTYSGTTIVDNTMAEDGMAIDLDLSKLVVTDGHGAHVTINKPKNNVIYYEPIAISNETVDSDGQFKSGVYYVKDGSKVTLSFDTKKTVNTPVAKVNGNSIGFTSSDNKHWTGSYSVTPETYIDGSNLVPEIKLSDNYGNEANVNSQNFHTVTYYTGIEITNLSYTTDNPAGTATKIGDTITVSFKTNHRCEMADSWIETNDYQLDLSSSDGINWIASYKVKGKLPDQSTINFWIKVVDASNNNPVEIDNSSIRPIVFYAPISIKDLIMTSSNSIDGNNYLINGDSVAVSFTANHLVYVDGSINNLDPSISVKDNIWTATKDVSQGDLEDQNSAYFSLDITDIAGNEAIKITQEDQTNILKYYAPISVENLLMKSNNATNESQYLINGNTLSVSFSSNHDVSVKGRINGSDTAFSMDSGEWFGSVVITDGAMADQSTADFECTISDVAGNTPIIIDTTMQPNTLTYYAPIIVDGLSMVSDNAVDAEKYVKDGDTITVSFAANHGVLVNGLINGVTPMYDEENNRWVITHTIDGNMTDLTDVFFHFDLTDAAGNKPVSINEGLQDNTLKYYAPLSTAQSTLTSSNAKNPNYAKAGDYIRYTSTTNHDVKIIEASIHGFSAQTSTDGNRQVASLSLEGGAQGSIDAQMNLADVAGNTLTLSQESEIIYDDVSPVVKLDPHITGFNNKTVNVTGSFDDTNLDTESVSFMVNQEEKITAHQPGSTLTQTVPISTDGTYTLTAKAEDAAGNRSDDNGGTVIIDKTNPTITLIDIDLDKTPAYKTGVKMSNHFVVKDAYLDHIDAFLTNKTGINKTVAWNIESAIDDEGEKELSLSAEDKAKNRSDEVEYGFWIDGTAPMDIVTETLTNTPITSEKTKELGKGSKLSIELDEIWVGNERPDNFTKLELVNTTLGSKKSLIKDNEKVSKTLVEMVDAGDYTLTVSAVDEVGNEMAVKKYQFSVNAEKTAVMATDNLVSPWVFVFLALFGVVFVVVMFLLIKKKKGNENEDIEGSD